MIVCEANLHKHLGGFCSNYGKLTKKESFGKLHYKRGGHSRCFLRAKFFSGTFYWLFWSSWFKLMKFDFSYSSHEPWRHRENVRGVQRWRETRWTTVTREVTAAVGVDVKFVDVDAEKVHQRRVGLAVPLLQPVPVQAVRFVVVQRVQLEQRRVDARQEQRQQQPRRRHQERLLVLGTRRPICAFHSSTDQLDPDSVRQLIKEPTNCATWKVIFFGTGNGNELESVLRSKLWVDFEGDWIGSIFKEWIEESLT